MIRSCAVVTHGNLNARTTNESQLSLELFMPGIKMKRLNCFYNGRKCRRGSLDTLEVSTTALMFSNYKQAKEIK